MTVPAKSAAGRLVAARSSPDFVIYGLDLMADGKKRYTLSIFSLISTGEVFVAVNREGETRVESFISRHKCCSPEVRRAALTLVDSADAYELARRINRHWRRRAIPTFY